MSKIIAEIAQYHDGSVGRAHAMIDALADAGVNCIKFQTHIAKYESSIYEPWRVKFSTQDKTRYDYWKRMEFDESVWRELKAHCDEKNVEFLSSPFSIEGAQLLEKIGVSSWKLASGEVGNKLLTDYLISTGKPIICSSGMSYWNELDAFVEDAKRKCIDLTLLQCTSKYPTQMKDVGLNVMQEMKKRYGVRVGLSDHTGTIFPCLTAVALGAECVEVHACMSKRDFGPDVVASLTIEQIEELCNGIKSVEEMLNSPVDKDSMSIQLGQMRTTFTKSLCAKKDFEAGHILKKEDLVALKPLIGISVQDMDKIVGKRLKRFLRECEIIKLDDVEDA